MIFLLIKLIIDKRFALIFFTIIGLSLVSGVFAVSLQHLVMVDITGNTAGQVQWAVPEARVGASSTNWSTTYYLTVRDASDYDDVLHVSPSLSTTTEAGDNLNPEIFSGVASGTYDVFFKSDQHLSRKLNNVSLSESGVNNLNFTQSDNSPTLGPVRLLAGDINLAGVSTSTLGDDVINSVDLGVMIDNLDLDDPTSKGLRANLNRDTVVNSVDLGVMIDNLDKEGDR